MLEWRECVWEWVEGIEINCKVCGGGCGRRTNIYGVRGEERVGEREGKGKACKGSE